MQYLRLLSLSGDSRTFLEKQKLFNEFINIAVQNGLDIRLLKLGPCVFYKFIRVKDIVPYLRAKGNVHLACLEIGGISPPFFEFQFVET